MLCLSNLSPAHTLQCYMILNWEVHSAVCRILGRTVAGCLRFWEGASLLSNQRETPQATLAGLQGTDQAHPQAQVKATLLTL